MILYEPPESLQIAISQGRLLINAACRTVNDPQTGRFVAALVPTEGFSNAMQGMPMDAHAASEFMQTVAQLKSVEPMLQAIQLTSSVGAIASIANLGVSCVGFALVLKQLSRVEGKLDDALNRIDELRRTVDEMKLDADLLSAARLRSAGECLERAVAAESANTRRDLAARARDLFQEARNRHFGLWQRCNPWLNPSLNILTAMDMKARFETAAVGEIQAEFVNGDLGAFRHAVRAIAKDYSDHYLFSATEALRSRSNDATERGLDGLAPFAHHFPQLVGQLTVAHESTRWTQRRLSSFEDDASLPEELGAEPHEIAAATRNGPKDGLLVLMSEAFAA